MESLHFDQKGAMMNKHANDIRAIEEKLLNLLPASLPGWDPILSLIRAAEESGAYRSLGHPTLSDWLRKVRTLSHLKGGPFRYEISPARNFDR